MNYGRIAEFNKKSRSGFYDHKQVKTFLKKVKHYFLIHVDLLNKYYKTNIKHTVMKKLIFMALLGVAVSPACNKDKDNVACRPANELIRNTWKVTSARIENFNAANNAETDAVVSPAQNYTYVITADRIRRTNASGNIDFYNPYTFANNVITFKDETGTEQRYEVVTLTNNRMQWRQEKTGQPYTTVAGQNKTAARQVITIDFTAQPQSN